jgi:putative DNA primase/helicase
VTAVETEEGRRWAESKIKSLTGGDRIAARFMRQDFFEFTPSFKLIIAGNHKPGLRSVDEAIRRRFHLIPFTVTVPANERDETLPERLKAEWPGILAWAVRGCIEWQRIGLAPPECVRAATAAYLEAEDALAAWIDDETQIDPNAWESSAALFYSWKRYADRSGEYHGSLKKFRQRLEDRSEALGLRPGRNSDGRRGFHGLRVAKTPDLVSGAEDGAAS